MLRSLSFTTVALALGVLTTPASAAPGSNLKGIEAGTGTSVTEQSAIVAAGGEMVSAVAGGSTTVTVMDRAST